MNKTPMYILVALAATATLTLAVRGGTSAYKQYAQDLTPVWMTPQELAQFAQPAQAAGATAQSSVTNNGLSTPRLDEERAKRIVNAVSNGQSKVLGVFQGTQGATGVIVQGSAGGRFIGWITPNIDAMFVGPSFTLSGRNITQDEMIARGFADPINANNNAGNPAINAQLANATPSTINSNLFSSLERATGITEGTGGPTLYAFHDLNCPACAQFWQTTRQPIAAGKLRVRWIPVAIINQTSMGKAAAVLSRPNPLQAFIEHEARISPSNPINPTPAQANAIEGNNALLNMVTQGQPATPILISRDSTGSPSVTRGMPPDPAAFWVSLR